MLCNRKRSKDERDTRSKFGAVVEVNYGLELSMMTPVRGESRLALSNRISTIERNAQAAGRMTVYQPNDPIHAFLRCLRMCDGMSNHLTNVTKDLTKFELAQPGKQFDLTVSDINMELDLGKAPEVLELLHSAKTSIDDLPIGASPTIANMKIPSYGTDAILDLETMPKQQLIASINADLLDAKGMVIYPQVYEIVTQALGNDSIDPAIHAKIKGGQGKPPKICDACNQRGHEADGCWKRGLAFLPPSLAKKIRQYNLRFGDAPKSPPVDDTTKPIPHIPSSPRPSQSRPSRV